HRGERGQREDHRLRPRQREREAGPVLLRLAHPGGGGEQDRPRQPGHQHPGHAEDRHAGRPDGDEGRDHRRHRRHLLLLGHREGGGAPGHLGDRHHLHAGGGERMVGDHPVLLRGLTFDPKSGAPTPAPGGAVVLAERTEDGNFVKAMLGELASADGRQLLAKTVVSTGPGTKGLKLFQPVHGAYNLALLEAHCDQFGDPRLDPNDIDSSGMVIRRVNGAGREAWVKRAGKVAGWVTLSAADLDRDPDPARRDGPDGPGPAEVRRTLLKRMGATSNDEETVEPLFAAPPNDCKALGRTLLYGVVMTASADARNKLSLLADFLRGLVAVFDAFQTPKLLAAMNKVSLDFADGKAHPAGDFLAKLADVLVQGQSGKVKLPKSWPKVGTKDQAEIVAQARTAAGARM